LQHIGDARLELAEVGQTGSATPFIAAASSRRRVWPIVAAAAVAATVGLAAWILAPRPSAGPVRRFSIQVPASMTLLTRGTGIALSPDGQVLVYGAGGAVPQLVKRQLDDLNTEPIRGGEGGTWPFFSPDGAWIGFFAEGKLKKVPAGGGVAVTICDAPPNARGTWGDDGTIVVARTRLYRVASGGGTLDVMLDVVGDEQLSQPAFLPGSKAILVVSRVPPDGGRIEAIDLKTRARHPLVEGSTPRLAVTGDLLFTREGRIWATRFDSKRLAAIGVPVQLVESVALADADALFTLSRDGSLAYVPRTAQAAGALVWLDRTGISTAVLPDKLALLYPRLSPDGTHVAASVTTESGLDLWTFDLERGSRLRLTTEHNNRRNVWSPDGQQIAFFSLPAKPQPGVSQDIYAVPSIGGKPNRLLDRPGPQWPDSWSPDGRFLVFEDGCRSLPTAADS
jgi:eukaryotic-like serine/threonine-protein kinase